MASSRFKTDGQTTFHQDELAGRRNYGTSRFHLRASGGLPAGPGIGRSNFRSMGEFSDAVTIKYQQFYDQGYAKTIRQVNTKKINNDPLIIGRVIDARARSATRRWLSSEGIEEGPGQIIQVNRRLYNPNNISDYRVPDIRIPGASLSIDGTIGLKTAKTPQIRDFNRFSGGDNVLIVKPTKKGGSYGIVAP